MPRGACESIEGCDDEHCKLPLPCLSQHGVETGAATFAAGNADIGEFADHFEATLSGELPKVVESIAHALV